MAQRIRKHKCFNCHIFFTPDYRNVKRQKYCSKPECLKAAKAASQRKWLQKKENHNYFSGSNNVGRVQEWRKKHPGYWRRKSPEDNNALQDSLSEKEVNKQPVKEQLTTSALQDILIGQQAVLIGLIAQFSANALQDDIVKTTRRLQQLGDDIFQNNGGYYDTKKHLIFSADSTDSETIRKGGSAFGPRSLSKHL
jgi:hypothetical protein